MINSVSPNTQAVLLLTAPLIVGRSGHSSEFLTHGEYNRLARILHENQQEPADLLGPDAGNLVKKLQDVIEGERLTRLLGRGFLLSQAIERWQARSIWVVSRADSEYPKRLKERLKEAAPSVLYGCGDADIFNTGGLAIVGSRQVVDVLVEYTESIGRLTAQSHRTVVSGGARGIDRAAMFGALQTGGRVVGVLADSLERMALARELREYLINEQLVLISPYDPAAGFDVGHAMERNKIIYALADAALIVSSDFEKGGTWAGAVEQLKKLHLVPIYVRSNGNAEKGLRALIEKGALPWTNPSTQDAFEEALNIPVDIARVASGQKQLPLSIADKATSADVYDAGVRPILSVSLHSPSSAMPPVASSNELPEKLKELLTEMKIPKTEDEVAAALQIPKSQVKELLSRLVKDRVLRRKIKPVRYFTPSNKQESLFDNLP
ncbi:MAG: DNA-processing protein DprA [Chloroflexi bacterium]|nr:DNA-processing protein DprA [Chloroflexota bacterium]